MPKTKIPLDAFTREPADVYHAARGGYLSSHSLSDFRRSPLQFFWRQSGLAPDDDRPAYLVGRAAHTRILEGREKFLAEYAIGGPINPTTGRPYGPATKMFAEWAAAQGKPVLTEDQVTLVESIAAGVARSAVAADLLLHGQAEGVVRADYCGTPCQIRVDWVHPCRGIIDLKTCEDLTWFESDARRYGYHWQLAFYRSVSALGTGLEPCDLPVHVIAVEKRAPYRCGVWRVGPETLAIAQKENEFTIAELLRCQASGVWPTRYEDVRELQVI